VVQACPGIKQDPISKITKVKRAGGTANMVKYLPNKHETLSSSPRTANKQESFSPKQFYVGR
jgi:hypothetical protein